MSAQLNRLQAFLADAGELEIVAPAATLRPDYFGRCARLLGATLVAAQIAAVAAPAPVAAASPVAAPAPVTIADSNAAAPARDSAATKAAMLAVKEISSRYLSHGHSPVKPLVAMLNPNEQLDETPAVLLYPGDVCKVQAVRVDYSKTDPRLARMADTPEMRALVLVHESMHCRTGLALMRHVKDRASPLSERFALMFNESSADALAVLTLARKDGIPVALNVLDRLAALRADEAVALEPDWSHDSRQTLQRIRTLLVTTPERLNSDGAIMSLAVTEALTGASKTFSDSLSAEQKGHMATPEFKADMARFHQTVEEVATGYLKGPYELGAPTISLNKELMSNGLFERLSTSFLAKRAAAPSFTPASLRSEAELITQSVIASASVAGLEAAASTAAPELPDSAMLAIGRLRSRLGSIYVSPQSEPHTEHDHDQLEESSRPQ